MCNIRAKQTKTAIRIENCVDNLKNLMVMKMMQFDTLIRHYDVIIRRHHFITIVRTFGSYNNQNQKNCEGSKFPYFCKVLGYSDKKRGETLSKLTWKLEIDID